MKKILLAGGNGIIGSYLCFQLKEQASVTSIGYSNYPNKKDFINIDFTKMSQVTEFAEICDHFDVLIFLVGLVHSKGKGKNLPDFNKVNYQTLLNLLSALKNNNKIPEKIIFASTISVYGERFDQSYYKENNKLYPLSPYAITKRKAEKYLQNNFSNKSWILRFAPVYSTNYLINIHRRTKINHYFYRVGDGLNKLSLCNINNIKLAIEGIINNQIPPDIYNLSDKKYYNYKELLEWQKAPFTWPIPVYFIKLLYWISKIIKHIFLIENTIKLITDNVYPSDKIRSFIDLPANLHDINIVDT
ncbi:uncharacterized protein METZ01_LOCUS167435 [marine metagenome]|uniref:NAD-dependent epimerase/dehydratase domain-containing protein n=1 Tax=marine metagenome TaxID=408172 RepID=A0A382BM20_9ZZZZ